MINLHLDDESLKSIRLSFSPLWETIGSLVILTRYRGTAPSPYTTWAREVRDRMPAALAQQLIESVRGLDVNQFAANLVLIPDPARNTIESELWHFQEQQGEAKLARQFGKLLQQYWHLAIAPYWTAIRSSLEEEILFRGRTLAVEGSESMLTELGGRVTWAPPRLTAPYHRDLDVALNGSRLVLVPTVFASAIRIFVQDGQSVAMSYQARGTGHFQVLTAYARESSAREDRLALLLGKGRAQVIRELQVPTTTTAVAQSLGMAKSTVSQHLAVLAATGVVWKQRLGGQVFYQLDASGVALLRQLDL
ncbi:ArsR/SmtB family transcription factor [Micromonospora aurantiaca (nom. illeg.)]|uniref:ArsR/SmtB family transcription factor n=1 Tax=Micromonospora aurantiaca (nom. illeg.) TaxID=47850 RepID=UPI00147737A2|nr:ArsR family transcriptional regulator [Micromonospora aurantiaca]